jgi:hypothetical protein
LSAVVLVFGAQRKRLSEEDARWICTLWGDANLALAKRKEECRERERSRGGRYPPARQPTGEPDQREQSRGREDDADADRLGELTENVYGRPSRDALHAAAQQHATAPVEPQP